MNTVLEATQAMHLRCKPLFSRYVECHIRRKPFVRVDDTLIAIAIEYADPGCKALGAGETGIHTFRVDVAGRYSIVADLIIVAVGADVAAWIGKSCCHLCSSFPRAEPN